MTIQDQHPAVTKSMRDTAQLLQAARKHVGTGAWPASTDFYRACCELYGAAKSLMDTVETDLSIQLCEQRYAAARDAAVWS